MARLEVGFGSGLVYSIFFEVIFFLSCEIVMDFFGVRVYRLIIFLCLDIKCFCFGGVYISICLLIY